jgi:hypothetical protein
MEEEEVALGLNREVTVLDQVVRGCLKSLGGELFPLPAGFVPKEAFPSGTPPSMTRRDSKT